MKFSKPVARGIALGVSITLVLGFALAVLLSNVAVFEGPLGGGVLQVGPINSGGVLGEPGGVLNLNNNTAKTFQWNVTNKVDRIVDFNMTLHFFLPGIIQGGFTVVSFEWSLDGVVLPNTPETGSPTSWRYSTPLVFNQFETRTFSLTLTFVFVGGGSYSFGVWASDGQTA